MWVLWSVLTTIFKVVSLASRIYLEPIIYVSVVESAHNASIGSPVSLFVRIKDISICSCVSFSLLDEWPQFSDHFKSFVVLGLCLLIYPSLSNKCSTPSSHPNEVKTVVWVEEYKWLDGLPWYPTTLNPSQNCKF